MELEKDGDSSVDRKVTFWYITITPIIVTIRGIIFKNMGRMGSLEGKMDSQFIELPPMIAPMVKKSIGVVLELLLSEMY